MMMNNKCNNRCPNYGDIMNIDNTPGSYGACTLLRHTVVRNGDCQAIKTAVLNNMISWTGSEWELIFQQAAVEWRPDYEIPLYKITIELIREGCEDITETMILGRLISKLPKGEYIDAYDGEVILRIIRAMRLLDKI